MTRPSHPSVYTIMAKTKLLLAMLIVWPAARLEAQTLLSPSLQEAKEPAEKTEEKIPTITIHAAGEPDPALRYRFWPAPSVRTNNSPTPFVNRAILLAMQKRNDEASRKVFFEGYDKWDEMPLAELPREEVTTFLNRFGGEALKEFARAENDLRVDYDLKLNELSAAELIQTLLPEFQEMRHLARILRLRIRLAIAEERWDDAVDDIRLGFRLAEVAGHSTDFLIGRLVGFAVSGMMMEVSLEAMQQPHCPSFYWALASLPENRLFETRDSIEFESVLISRMMKAPALPDHPIGADEARMLIKDMADQATLALTYGGDERSNRFNAKMMSGLYVVTMADDSRDFLARTTDWGDKARDLSAPEAVLRASYLKFERSRDSWVKWSLLPPEVWGEYQAEMDAADQGNLVSRDILSSLVAMLRPAVDAARRAGRRTLQQRNFLISIEALRMYAAENGELPESIDKLRPVPFWDDGMALRPFGYNRTSPSTATLTRDKRWDSDPETTFRIELMKGNH